MVLDFDYTKKPGVHPCRSSAAFKPLISVVTPFYNAASFFEETYNCIVSQTFPWFEWIIVDDGSTKKEDFEILKCFADKDKRIRLFCQKNQGPAAARNFAIMQSQTNYILTIDADDLFEPVMFEYLFWGLCTNPKASWSYCDSVGFGPVHYTWRKKYSTDVMKTENLLPITSLMRKDHLQEVGCYHVEEQYLYEDWHLWLTLLGKGRIPAHTQLFGFWYRRSESGVFATLNKNPKQAQFAKKQIKDAADTIRQDIKAFEFPLGIGNMRPDYGRLIPEEYKIEKKGPNALVLISHMKDSPSTRQSIQYIKALIKNGISVGVCSLLPACPSLQQELLSISPDIFNLPAFVAPECMEDFLVAYAKTRQVDLLILDGCLMGLSFVDAMKKAQRNLFIAGFLHDKLSYSLAKKTFGIFDICFYKNSLAHLATEKENFVEYKDTSSLISALLAAHKKHLEKPFSNSFSVGKENEFFREIFIKNYAVFKQIFDKNAFFVLNSADAQHLEPTVEDFSRTAELNNPLISIITPYCCKDEYLHLVYQSVINQTFPWFEWIIVDDKNEGSYKEHLLKSIEECEPRAKVIKNMSNGYFEALEQGIAASSGEIIVFLASDTILEPQYLEELYWALLSHPDAAWCYSLQHQSWDAKKVNAQVALLSPIEKKIYDWFFFKGMHFTSAVRKNVFFKHCQAFKNYGKGLNAWLFWAELLAKKEQPILLEAKLAWQMDYNFREEYLSFFSSKDTYALIDEMTNGLALLPKNIRPAHSFKTDTFMLPKDASFGNTFVKDNTKLNIAMIAPWMVLGGADQFNLDFLSGMKEKGHEISILTTLPQESPWAHRFKKLTADVFSLCDFLPLDQFAAFVGYFVHSRQVDVLLVSNSTHGYYLLPWLRNQFPNLVLVDYVHSAQKEWRAGGYGRHSAGMCPVLDYTYVCNEYCKNLMLSDYGCIESKIKTIYIGVNEVRFSPQAVLPGSVYSSLKIEKSRPIVLFVCRMAPEKRPYLMLNIAKKMHESGNDAAFVVVGDGFLLNGMKQFVEKHALENTVYFAGPQSDVRGYYKDAALTLICSSTEGLALTAYESMAMETPVVTSDVGGQTELVCHKTGAVMPLMQDINLEYDYDEIVEKEVDAYALAITKLIENPTKLKEMAKTCRRRIEDGFSISKMANYFEEEFIRLCKEKKSCANAPKATYDNVVIGALSKEIVAVYSEYAKYCEDVRYLQGRNISMTNSQFSACQQAEFELEIIKSSITHRVSFGLISIINRVPILGKWLINKRKKL